MSKPEKPLSAQHEKFCLEYVLNCSAAKAYIAAGYSSKGADQSAARLLKNAQIQKRIAALKADVAGTVGVTAAALAQELLYLGRSDIGEVVTWSERAGLEVRDSDRLEPRVRRAIKSVTETVTTTTSPEGWSTESRKFKIELHEKKGALDSAIKMLGYNAPDKIEATMKVDPVDTTEAIISRLKGLDGSAATGSDSEPDA